MRTKIPFGVVFFLFLSLGLPSAVAQTISTVAGGGPTNLPALSANLGELSSVALDGAGNVYITASSQIYKISPAGQLTSVAGNHRTGYFGSSGFSGDGGPATSAQLNSPHGVFVDRSGNIFIADSVNERIREVLASTGTIETVAGTGMSGYSGDGAAATSAKLNGPSGVFVDGSGNIFIADTYNNRIRKVLASTGTIQTVAGNGKEGFSGDGGPAAEAELDGPDAVFVDGSGNIFIADTANQRIREVLASTGEIRTVAGNGKEGFSGDGGPAIQAELHTPRGVFVDSSGNLFVADSFNNRVREVLASTGTISTIAGNGSGDFRGDGGPATSAELDYPGGVFLDGSGNIFIADGLNERIRKVMASTGKIQTVAGNGRNVYSSAISGDGGPATNAELNRPSSVFVDSSGNIFIADGFLITKVLASTGVIQTIVGNGTKGFGGDGGPAIAAELNDPSGVFVDRSGNIFIADLGNERIREVLAATGTIRTVAGNGRMGFSGDGGPAASATLSFPIGVFVDRSGNVFISDFVNCRIRKVLASTGTIQTVAGNGVPGYGGDGGPATSAKLNGPSEVFVDDSGNIFIADGLNSRIREVLASTGTIRTVAGNGKKGFSGDGGPATSAELSGPSGVFVDRSGNIFIVDSANDRIREVEASTGTIRTVAGSDKKGFSGDGGPATSAELNAPSGVFGDSSGRLFIADTGNERIRCVTFAHEGPSVKEPKLP